MEKDVGDVLQGFMVSSYTQSVCAAGLCMERCVQPLMLISGDDASVESINWLRISNDLKTFIDEFQVIGDRVQDRYAKDVLNNEDLLPQERAEASTAKHDLCNRLFEVGLLLGRVDSLLDAIVRDGLSGSDELNCLVDALRRIEGWIERISEVELVTHSDVEPINYLNRRFKRINLTREGKIPESVNCCALNMILFHLVLNACNHTSKDGALKVLVRQTSGGVVVSDDGGGMGIERLLEIREAVAQGRAVNRGGNGGSGFGIRDSVILLKCLFKEWDHSLSAELIIESWVDRGTKASVIWNEMLDWEFDEKHAIRFRA